MHIVALFNDVHVKVQLIAERPPLGFFSGGSRALLSSACCRDTRPASCSGICLPFGRREL